MKHRFLIVFVIGWRRWAAQNAAARLMGVGQSTVFAITKGGSPRTATLDRLIAASGRSADYWLMGRAIERQNDQASSIVVVPILSATASAGSGALNHDEDRVGELSFERAELIRLGASPQHLHLIRVEGDSMEPTIQHGRLVMIDTSKRRHGQDGVYAIRSGQGEEAEARIKRLRYGTNAGVEIISDNSVYPVERVPDRDEIKLIGRAIWTERWL